MRCLLLALSILVTPHADAGPFRRLFSRPRQYCAPVCVVPAVSAPPKPTQFLTTPSGRRIPYIDIPKERSTEPELERAVPFALKKRDSETFGGSWRASAKTSLSDAGVQSYNRLSRLLATLEDDEFMRSEHEPRITAKSERVAEEERNVQVDCWLLGASREEDNDYHLIIGDRRNETDQDRMMTVEISGLPKGGPFREILQVPREAYKEFFQGEPPSSSFRVFPESIRVRVKGSLFFDKQHGPGGVGHGIYKPNYVWEIHPVEEITFDDQ
jgi:hypothetical protein